MSEILVDARPLQGDSASRGIGTYVRGLLEGLAGLGLSPRVRLLLTTGAAPAEAAPGTRAGPEGSGPEAAPAPRFAIGARVPRLERRAQVLADPLLVSAAVRRARPRLYHATEQGQPWRTGVPVVVTVHDLIPFLRPGYSRRSRWLRSPGMHLIRRAGLVVVPSDATARDCVRVAGVAPERIRTVPHGLSPIWRPAAPGAVEALRDRLRLPRPYLLGVGTFEPHKGLPHLVAVTRRLRRDHDVDLVVAGRQGVFAAAVRAQLALLGGHGRDLGFVTAQDLVALYSGAAAFVFPSAYEGFGLPLLEAMGCACPVVAFANSSLPEVGGAAAVLVPDGDRTALEGAVARLLSDPEEAARRGRLGRERAAGFTWAAAARRTVDVYGELLGEPLLG